MALQLKFKLPVKLYIRDPQDSSYGKRLLSEAIILIDALGFESFTFRKLGVKMNSSEVSIYRYFENKHLLLLYLNCWYWEWVSYLIDLKTTNITDPQLKLKQTIHCMIYASKDSKLTEYINEHILFQIIMKEGSKTYHIADVDKENKYGLFSPYLDLIAKISSIVLENNKDFKYEKSLASTMFEMICNQIYYAEHLPGLTNISKDNTLADLENMITDITFCAIHR
jgi:hypothetical protein